MYIPPTNIMDDPSEIVQFIERFSFGTIITAKNHLPVATHLPFLFSKSGDSLMLTSHFARANDHWKDVEGCPVLVIFSEPHAYISPSHYDKVLNVPTWNYISVHCYGTGNIISESDNVITILERTINQYESNYKTQWDGLPKDYKTGMAKGIVAFEILVTDIQAKKKLSQNKNDNEQQRIIKSLSQSPNENDRLIAEYMSKD